MWETHTDQAEKWRKTIEEEIKSPHKDKKWIFADFPLERKDFLKEEIAELKSCSTEKMIADVLTKPLPHDIFEIL